MTRRYPLHALKTLRAHAVDAQRQDLEQRAALSQVAAEQRARAEAVRARSQAELQISSGQERLRLEHGQARAADLQAQAAWLDRTAAELTQLELQEQQARQRETALCKDEAHAQLQLAERQLEARVLQNHAAGWLAARRRQQELNEEELASEAWSARREVRGEKP